MKCFLDVQVRLPGREEMPSMSATDAFRLPSIALPGVESVRKAVSPQTIADEASRAAEIMLIREAQAGSRAAFDALVRQYDGAVLRLALRLTGSEQDAQDIHQEAFLKAYRYLQNFRFECSFYTWIYRIATNLCLDHLRRRKSRREDQSVILDGRGDEHDLLSNVSDDRSGANPARELERKILGEKIQDALGQLTPRERMVFELKHYQGLKLRAIGEMLQTTEETAKNTLFRATRKLRLQLAEMHG
jgi:RNA polymerase sigma-70 factor (ECF subfamily)